MGHRTASAVGIDTSRDSSVVRRSGAVVPAVMVSLLPKCPACWSAYAGLSSALGVSFTIEEAYLLPLTVLMMLMALVPLALAAVRRRHTWPLGVGVLSAAAVLVGKFGIDSDLTAYLGLLALVGASLFNSRRRAPSTCRAA
jgi:hypothetical protein